MSDITYPDKSIGDQFTAENANEIKTAVNSKQDSLLVTANKSETYVLGTDDLKELYGGVIYVSAAITIEIPPVSPGMNFTIIVTADAEVSIDPNGDDRIILDGVALDDGDKVVSTSTSGDIAVFSYESVDGWYCSSGTIYGDHWTDGGA